MILNLGEKLKIICSLVILLAIALMPLGGASLSSAQSLEELQLASTSPATDSGNSSNPYLVRTFVDAEGREIDEVIVPGRPPEIKAEVAILPELNLAMGINTLSNVPAFDWSYGCSATSAAMMIGYYDNTGYPNMYAGPTNGGLCPMDNSVWGPGISGSEGECPLSATHEGKDGRTTKGHVDDYWVYLGSKAPDPFIGNWSEHTHGDCTGDFMGTNQYNLGNTDGSTTFFFYTNGDPLYDYVGREPNNRDGCHGLKLFVESRGYTVVTNFSQYIYGQALSNRYNGFTFADFQSEIDAGRPVLIQVAGHTMLGYGYNTEGQTVYIHDTWDHNNHSMPWGGTYGGLRHYGVTVIQIQPTGLHLPTVATNVATLVEETTATLNGAINNDCGEPCYYRFGYSTTSGGPYAYTSWSLNTKTSGQSFSQTISGLAKGTEYYFRAQAKNSAGIGSGLEVTFLTKPDAPISFSASSVGTTQVDLSWTKGSGTQKTKIQRKQGSYPANKDDGTQVYFDSGTSISDTGLTPGTTYYYRAWSYVQGSEQWSDNYAQALATTGSASNNAPNAPSNPSPPNHATGVAINANLSWTGGDPDAGDTVTYDVYFGTSSTPPLVSNDQSGTTYDPGTLSYNTPYYWKIIATDNHGTPTTGLLWDFTTQVPVDITWNCPLGNQALIAPNPGAGRPLLSMPADCAGITASAGAELWGIYYLIETGPGAGTWLWYVPDFASSTLTQLKIGEYYWVVVSAPCTLTIPQS